MEQQPNIDIRKTTPVLTSTGNKIWSQGFILRKASRFLTGLPSDSIIPIPIFYDQETMEVNREGLGKEYDFLFESAEE